MVALGSILEIIIRNFVLNDKLPIIFINITKYHILSFIDDNIVSMLITMIFFYIKMF